MSSGLFSVVVSVCFGLLGSLWGVGCFLASFLLWFLCAFASWARFGVWAAVWPLFGCGFCVARPPGVVFEYWLLSVPVLCGVVCLCLFVYLFACFVCLLACLCVCLFACVFVLLSRARRLVAGLFV